MNEMNGVYKDQAVSFLPAQDVEGQADQKGNTWGRRVERFSESTPGKLILGGLILIGVGTIGALIAVPLALSNRASISPTNASLNLSQTNKNISYPTTYLPTDLQTEPLVTSSLPTLQNHADPGLPEKLESQIDSSSLESMLQELLTFGSRSSWCDARGNGFANASDWLKEKIEELDLPVEKSTFNYEDTYYGMSLRQCSRNKALSSSNLFTMFPGESQECIIIGAHLDTVTNTVGANDNGSGVVSLFEMIRVLQKENFKPKHSIVFAFWGAEEAGKTLLGSADFLHADNAQITLANLWEQAGKNATGKFTISGYINLDMVAGNASGNEGIVISDPDAASTFWEYLPYSGFKRIAEGTRRISQLFSEYFTRKDIPFTKTKMRRVGDHASFQDKSIPSVMLYTGYDNCYHKNCDNGSNVDFQKLENCTKSALNVAVRLASK
ncbi:M20/M25/M40 family metallo-hydrolase [uncultured Endozoicomonas sp.]|uniref:M28 family metallopeptidase n=1 Tax=uncultured Endozoicomonas sp. TaxID=432652 RepID=UPI002636EC9C|nr:M20/M25/M40 family metallo-hydrolase [uncultured Endozoicomonas sp.]